MRLFLIFVLRAVRVTSCFLNRDSLTAKGGGGSFAGDCAQVAQIVNNCTGRSLAIVDEFGKGTVRVYFNSKCYGN